MQLNIIYYMINIRSMLLNISYFGLNIRSMQLNIASYIKIKLACYSFLIIKITKYKRVIKLSQCQHCC